MVLQETEAVVQTALSDTILATCRKTLPYHDEFSIEGMLHIVLDKKEVVLVNIKETVFKQETRENAEAANSEEVLGESSPSRPVTRRGRKPKKRQIESDNEVESKESSRLMSPVRKSPRTPRPKPSVQYVDSDDNVEVTSDSVEESDEELKPEKDRTITDEPLMQSQTAECETALVKLEKCQSGSSESAAVVGPSGNQDTNNPQDEAVLSATDSKTETDDQYEPASSDPEQCAMGKVLGNGEVVKSSEMGDVDLKSGKSLIGNNVKNTQKMDDNISVVPESQKGTWKQATYWKHQKERDQKGSGYRMCHLCKKRCRNFHYLKVHVAAYHSGVHRYKCRRCGHGFLREEELTRHMDTHPSFMCDLCGVVFQRQFTLSAHRNIHLNKQPFKCGFCMKAFRDPSKRKVHERVHTGEKPFKCKEKECRDEFVSSGKLVVHGVRVHGHNKPYQCQVCHRRFLSGHSWTVHKRTHTGERPYHCEECDKRFADNSTYRVHVQTHTGVKRFQCEICGDKFTRSFGLRKHFQRKHADDIARPYQCAYCDSGFRFKAQKSRHESEVHTGGKYQCRVCDMKFMMLKERKTHEATHGENLRPHKCEKCGKAFKSKKILNGHLRTHTGEKPFQCHLCAHRSRTKDAMNVHIRTHAGEKPFMCETCGREYASAHSLRKHKCTPIKTKHRENEFIKSVIKDKERLSECILCNKRFAKPHQARKHISREHTDHLRPSKV